MTPPHVDGVWKPSVVGNMLFFWGEECLGGFPEFSDVDVDCFLMLPWIFQEIH